MRKTKVWGGLTFTALVPAPNGSTQARTLVRATSERKATELLCAAKQFMSLYYFREYWTETGNANELLICDEGVWTSQVVHWGHETPIWKRLI